MKIHKDRILRNISAGLPLRIKPVFDDFHQLTVSEEGDYPLHRHHNYEVIVVDKGPYCCTLNGVFVQLNHGEFLIIKPGDMHQDHFETGQNHYVLHFKLVVVDLIERDLIQLFEPGVAPFYQCGTQTLDNPFVFFKKLQEELEQGDVFSVYVQDSMLETFFWQLIRLLPDEALSCQFQQLSQQLEFYTKLQALFKKNIRKNLKVSQMAKDFGLSERTLTYRFKEFIGQSPSQAFNAYRINQAAEMLISSEMSVQEVADEFGFDNPFHFSRVFKRTMGCAPREYRAVFCGRVNI